nr:hypothetical protein [Prevotella sp.]
MEKELNIAAILKDKPAGTKLWSPIFGNCKFSRLSDSGIRVFPIHNGFTSTEEKPFFVTGQYTLAGEVCLFPSKQMQDWSKFAWKKGDVLVSNDSESHIIFNCFSKDDYTAFEGKHWTCVSKKRYISHLYAQNTQGYHIEDNKDAAQTYINTIEKRSGGKLNRETLEIEKQPKQEFKDGDIVHIPAGDFIDEAIFIAKVETKGVLYSYVYMSKDSMIPLAKSSFSVSGSLDSLRLATDSEKQELFSALEKKNKRWNPDTKSIEDLPKKCEFKPMDWCLMKDSNKYWELCQFAYTRKVRGTTIYSAVGGLIYYKCIPYNEETKHLLGTTDEWKG